MVAPLIVAGIWDYGWLSRDELQFSPAPSASSLIESYVASLQFRTSFLPSENDESEIHGPFVSSRIRSEDFVLFEEAALQPHLDQLLLSDEWSSPATPDQRSAVGATLRAAFHESGLCYRLRFDETSSALHHEWGFVFVVFREFLFVRPESGYVTRFVIGYD